MGEQFFISYDDRIIFDTKYNEVLIKPDGGLVRIPAEEVRGTYTLFSAELDDSDIERMKELLEEDKEKALTLVTKLFKKHVDKANKPYIGHLKAVSCEMETLQGQIVGLLHDVLEDTAYPYEDLVNNFGLHIAFQVFLLTKPDDMDYLEYIKALKEYPIARAVKKADLKNNLDLNRLPKIGKSDIKRADKYKKALEILNRQEKN